MHSHTHRDHDGKWLKTIGVLALSLAPLWMPVIVAAASVELPPQDRNVLVFVSCLVGLGVAFIVLKAGIPKR